MNDFSADDLQRRVRRMVRLAICHQSKKATLKRADMVNLILPENSRAFLDIFALANRILEDVFGLKMTEVPGVPNNYIVQSVLEPTLRESWITKSREELIITGLLALVLSLIYLKSGTLLDSDLTIYLRKFGYVSDAKGNRIHEEYECFDILAAKWIQQAYLKKTKLPSADRSDQYEWSWGNRAKVEWNKENVVEFIKNIYKNNFTPEIKRQILRASELKNTGVKIDGGR